MRPPDGIDRKGAEDTFLTLAKWVTAPRINVNVFVAAGPRPQKEIGRWLEKTITLDRIRQIRTPRN